MRSSTAIPTRPCRSCSPTTDVLLVTAGDVRRRTGGNLYDRHVVRAAREAGITVRVAAVASAAQLAQAVTVAMPRVVVVDSIAFEFAAGALERFAGSRVLALAHMDVPGRRARRLLARADLVVAVSAALGRAVRARGARRVRVIRPGSDGLRRHPRDGAGTARAMPRDLRVLCVANWSAVKGIDVLLAACARVPGAALELVGARAHGPYARALAPLLARLGDRAVARGPLAPAGLARALSRADVLVAPSRAEGYGIAVAEALAQGVPVVASDIAAFREVAGSAAMLVRPGDVRDLARALSAMRDVRVRERYARAAARRGAVLPTWADAERSFVSLLVSEMRDAAGGGDRMPPRGVKSAKRKRQYEHIKKSETARGRSNKTAERIAAATTNKTRRKKGETSSRKTASRKKKSSA